MEDEDVKNLADEIVRLIKADFKTLHLSHNLVDTMTVSEDDEKIVIHIPAQIYDMYKFLKDKVIIYTGWGSYANQLEEEGSKIFKRQIGNHKKYISASIDGAIMTLNSQVEARGDLIGGIDTKETIDWSDWL